jgi:ribosomal protein RSM22 (predicted rRNA methylase)
MSFYLPKSLEDSIQTGLDLFQVKLSDSKKIADCVMQLSDFYIAKPIAQTPWNQNWCKIAYLAYYLPLNYIRARSVIARVMNLKFFDGLNHLVDFGSGLGSLPLATKDAGLSLATSDLIEISEDARKLCSKITPHLSQFSHKAFQPSIQVTSSTLVTASYSLTEVTKLPAWMLSSGGLLLIEPGTREDSRKLQHLRQSLINDGWSIHAPCTHQLQCPMLTTHDNDWCHDSTSWQQPDWFARIEDHLPIKNQTLHYSYLCARRDKLLDLPIDTTTHAGLARLTGDLQIFKGYAKQMICQNDARMFLSWQKKHFKNDYPRLPRGTLVRLKPNLTVKNNEIRPTDLQDVLT